MAPAKTKCSNKPVSKVKITVKIPYVSLTAAFGEFDCCLTVDSPERLFVLIPLITQ